MRLANTAARAPWVPLWQRTISALGPAQARRQERAAFAHPGSVTAAATETAAYRTGAIGRALGGARRFIRANGPSEWIDRTARCVQSNLM